MDDVQPIPPASDDGFIQDFVEERWRTSLSANTSVMIDLRELVPAMKAALPEVAYRRLADALEAAESVNAHLHNAGKYVIGEDAYKRYLAHHIEKTIGEAT